MGLAVALSRAREGINAPLVHAEVNVGGGLPGISIVGLPEAAVKESRDRVKAALQNAGFEFPKGHVTVNLAPADLPKDGGRFDLPIAVGILAASFQIPTTELARCELIGELSLGGELRGIGGALPAALAAREVGRRLLLPRINAAEAALVAEIEVLPVTHLHEVVAHLNGAEPIQPEPVPVASTAIPEYPVDLGDVHGQQHAKRALEIAAAGGHNLIMIGPPGTGKTMLASRLCTILPLLSEAEAVETAAVHSVASQTFDPVSWRLRPIRAPHHTASGPALVGGGSHPRPGEVSLAHNGVLFLDELTEFDRRVLDVLREPMETGSITISRAARQTDFPARFQLVAAMNPCPQGYDCDLGERCQCTAEQRRRHLTRISAPLLDRIDLQIEVPRPPKEALASAAPEGESSAVVRERVCAARHQQIQRQGHLNTRLAGRDVTRRCPLSATDRKLLETAMERFKLSARAYHRIVKVARTIADLAQAEQIGTAHLTEALSYRAMDRWRQQTG